MQYKCRDGARFQLCPATLVSVLLAVAGVAKTLCLQVRALTREVGSLKEDLRREVKRRERAVVGTREAEELRQEAEKRVKQLEYSKRSDF